MKEAIVQKIAEIINDIELMLDIELKNAAISIMLILAISIAGVLFMNNYGKIWFAACAIITILFAISIIYLMLKAVSTIIKSFFAINQLKYTNDLTALQNTEKKLSHMSDTLETNLNRHNIMLYIIAAWGLINSIYILLSALITQIKK